MKNVSIMNIDGVAVATYYDTKIVEYNRITYLLTLDYGGFKTNSTKNNMNKVLELLRLPGTVFQKKGEWYYGENEFIAHKFIENKLEVKV